MLNRICQYRWWLKKQVTCTAITKSTHSYFPCSTIILLVKGDHYVGGCINIAKEIVNVIMVLTYECDAYLAVTSQLWVEGHTITTQVSCNS